MLKGLQLLLTCRQWLLELRTALCESDESRSGRAEVYFLHDGVRRSRARARAAGVGRRARNLLYCREFAADFVIHSRSRE